MQEEKKASAPKKQGTAKTRRKRSTRAASRGAAAPASAQAAEKAQPVENAPAETPAPEAAAAKTAQKAAAQPKKTAKAGKPQEAVTAEPAQADPQPAAAAQDACAQPETEKEPPAEAPTAPETSVQAQEEPTEPEPLEQKADAKAKAPDAEPQQAAAGAAAGSDGQETPAAQAEAEAKPAQASEEAGAAETPEKTDTADEKKAGKADAGEAETADTEKAEPTDAEEPDNTDAENANGTDDKSADAADTEPADTEKTEPTDAGEPDNTGAENADGTDDKSAEAADTETADTEKAEPADAGDDAEEPQPESEEQRLLDMTRTVQLSIEQIMAHLDENAPAEAETAPPPEEPAEEPAPTLTDHLRGGLTGVARWLLLVLVFVVVIAIGGVVWLYRSATPDMLPQIRVTFAGQEIEPTSYRWKVPVVGKVIKRTYAETLSAAPVTLAQPVEQTSPDFTVSPGSYRNELTVTDSEDAVVFEGDVETFTNFQFPENGDYTAKLTVYSDESPVAGDAVVTGSETWQVAFAVEVRPAVHLFATSVQQGGVAAVTVGDTVDGRPPQISTTLKNAGFGKSSTGWVCYLPIPWNQTPGKQSLTVTVGDASETLEFEVQAARWDYKDYSSNYSLVTPYVGETDIPAELSAVLGESETQVAWADSTFVQPLLNTLDVELFYGTTEYVGRSRSQRGTNPGVGGRTATNMVLSTTWGELLIAPANGTVVLAKDLGDGFGNTLVIDHGAGVKSIFYHLQELNVKKGDQLKQGQSIATCGSALVAEMRIGIVPIDPRPVWRAQCDALKHY